MITRRSLLTGLLVGATCSAVGRELHADPSPLPAKPKRLVLVMTPNGTQQANFWPRTGFNSPILEPILNVPALTRRTTVVRGIFYPADLNGASGNEHDIGFQGFSSTTRRRFQRQGCLAVTGLNRGDFG